MGSPRKGTTDTIKRGQGEHPAFGMETPVPNMVEIQWDAGLSKHRTVSNELISGDGQ
jgi:hypothetical protein